jgi:Uma2 family endonuclease
MAQAVPVALNTFQEFLDFEETTPERHELFRGRIYAMAGGTANHDDIQISLIHACVRELRGRGLCRFVGENRKVQVKENGSGYRPDGAIACPPNDFNPRQGAYDNPTVVFEILSPSTSNFDRGEKFDDYKTLESLQEYVLIESDRIRIEVFSRLPDGRWAQSVYLKGSMVRLPSVGIELPLDELYENAVFDPEPKAVLEADEG